MNTVLRRDGIAVANMVEWLSVDWRSVVLFEYLLKCP